MPESYKNRIALSVINCISYDQRVLKMAETLRDLNCDVIIIGRLKGEERKNNTIPFKNRRFRMIFHKGFMFYMSFNIRLFFHLLLNHYDVLVANDLDTLLPNYLVSRLKRVILVYDSHEYFTGVPEIQSRRFVRWVWKAIEKSIFPHLKYVMTVSEPIASKYQVEYGIKPVVVRNFSRSSAQIVPFSRADLGIEDDQMLIILQGGGINIDRGGEELVEAVAGTDNVVLFIVGSGDVIPELKNKVVLLNLADRIKFIARMPWEEMMRYTKSADAGLTLDKSTNLNYRFSLPNKVFDYISAGIPVIASDLPEVAKVIMKYQCGVIIPEVNPETIRGAIVKLKDDKDLLNKLRENVVNASKYVSWDTEKIKVIDLYKKILNH